MLWFGPPLVIHFGGHLRVFFLVWTFICQVASLETTRLFRLQFMFIKIFLAKFKISFRLRILLHRPRRRRLIKGFLYIVKLDHLFISFVQIYFTILVCLLGRGVMRRWAILFCCCRRRKSRKTTGRYRTMTRILILLNSSNSSQLHWSLAGPAIATVTRILSTFVRSKTVLNVLIRNK